MIFKKSLHLAFAGFLVFCVQSAVAVTEQEKTTANLGAVFSILLNSVRCEAPVSSGEGNYDEIIRGSDGDDTLQGVAGRDLILGCSGDDRIIGGTGNDTLVGGSGSDTFVFGTGYNEDKILDFQDDVDTVELDDALWGGGLTVQDILGTYGENDAEGFVKLDFGNGDILVIYGLTDRNDLLDDILIF